jgi:hypothetical protein
MNPKLKNYTKSLETRILTEDPSTSMKKNVVPKTHRDTRNTVLEKLGVLAPWIVEHKMYDAVDAAVIYDRPKRKTATPFG